MNNLKTAIETNQVEEYMSTAPIINFIKDYESLNNEEMEKFVDIISKSVIKDYLPFNKQEVPPYPGHEN